MDWLWYIVPLLVLIGVFVAVVSTHSFDFGLTELRLTIEDWFDKK